MSESSKAVFLSYASQDAEAAKRISDALRQGGVEVWFDAEGGLEHGDEWDAKIRRQIKECVLFIAVISANTQAREEGYFRIEWELAAQRALGIASGVAFILPVVVDGTREPDALVPDRFRAVQWTKLPGGAVPPEVLARFLKLWSHRTGVLKNAEAARGERSETRGQKSEGRSQAIPQSKPAGLRYALGALAVLFLGAVLYFALKPRRSPEEIARIVAGAQAIGEKAAAQAAANTPLSEARQLALRARAMSFDKYDSTVDDFTAAESLLKHALELDPGDAEIWAVSSQLNKQFQGRGFDRSSARAAACLSQAQRAVKLDPDSIEAQFALGYAERGTDPVAAEQIMRKILARQPDHPGALFAMNSLLYRQGKVDESLSYLEKVGAQPKWAALAGYLKYLNYFSRARFAEADRAIRESIAVQPSANSVAGLAMVLLTWKGDAEAAARMFAEAPTAMRNEPRTVWMTAQVQLCRRVPDEALNALDRLPDDYIQDSWFAAPKAYYVGRAQALAGRPEAARVAWEAGLAIMQDRLKGAPANPGLHLVNGELLALLGRDDEALREARTVTELSRVQKLPWFASPVRIYAELGRADDALPLLAGLCPPKAADDVGWPLTPALLRLDPLWDKIRDDPRFQRLIADPPAPAPSSLLLSPANQPPADSKSVAVLAFANLSDDKENEYFSDGISEELLNVLAKVPGLKVTARTSSFHFKGKDTSIRDIAQQLGVAYVIEGSVRKQGTKVRITAQLIKAVDGFEVWSDTFTRDLKDIFAVQDEIAGLVAKNLSLKLGAGSAAPRSAVDPRAFELYVQARQVWNLRNEAGYARAEQLLNQALEIAPDFARAHAALADVWYFQVLTKGITGTFGRPDPPEFVRVLQKIRQALALDPASAEAHASLGNILFSTWKFTEAEQEYRAAIGLNPNYASAHQWLAGPLLFAGRVDESLAEMKLASELDPLSSRIADNYAFGLRLAGRYSGALAMNARALALQPTNGQAVEQRAYLLAEMGRGPEALAWVQQQPADPPLAAGCRLVVHALAGQRAEAEVLLPAARKDRFWAESYLLLRLDRKEEALASLDPASCESPGVYLDPIYDAIEDDPRFQKFIATIGWTQARERMKAWRAAHPPEELGAKP